MNKEILKELEEVEEMVKEAKEHEEYTEKYFILREGMIRLAGGFPQAALLTSLLGWTRHWLKTDSEIYQQIKAAAEVGDLEKIRRLKAQIRQGWFWKSYREMSEELLGMVSIKTCQRYVEKFEEKGLISSKDPAEHTTYRARWYKANIEKIKEALNDMGYQLDYYKNLNLKAEKQQTMSPSTCQNDKCENTMVSETESSNPLDSGICQNDKSSGQNDKSSGQNDKHLLYTYCNTHTSTSNTGMYVGSNPTPIETFSQNYKLTKYAKDNLSVLVSEYGELLVSESLKRTISAEKEKPIAYMKGILKKWASAGVKTLEDIEHYEENFRSRNQFKKSLDKSKSAKQNQLSKSDFVGLPETIRKQMESQTESVSPDVRGMRIDTQQQAEIKAKIDQMNEKFI